MNSSYIGSLFTEATTSLTHKRASTNQQKSLVQKRNLIPHWLPTIDIYKKLTKSEAKRS